MFLSVKCSQSVPLNSFCGLKSVGACTSTNLHLEGDSLALLQSPPGGVRDLERMVTPGQARAAAYKVAVLGAAGGIGQPLSLLIKMSPLVSDLHLYDIANVKGVVADLSHCNTPAKVCTFQQGLYQGFQQGGMTHIKGEYVLLIFSRKRP